MDRSATVLGMFIARRARAIQRPLGPQIGLSVQSSAVRRLHDPRGFSPTVWWLCGALHRSVGLGGEQRFAFGMRRIFAQAIRGRISRLFTSSRGVRVADRLAVTLSSRLDRWPGYGS